MTIKSFVLIATIACALSIPQRAMPEEVKAPARSTALVSIACSVMTGPGQPTISASVSRGVPLPTTGNCSDDVIGYLSQGFKIKSTLSSGTGGIIYILIK